jgi:hypothetical protein
MSAITATTDTHAITSAIKRKSAEMQLVRGDILAVAMVVLPIVACVSAVSLGVGFAALSSVLLVDTATAVSIQAGLATFIFTLTKLFMVWAACCYLFLLRDGSGDMYASSMCGLTTLAIPPWSKRIQTVSTRSLSNPWRPFKASWKVRRFHLQHFAVVLCVANLCRNGRHSIPRPVCRHRLFTSLP